MTVCLARLKKCHKSKFAPRLLSMIVGILGTSASR